MCHSRILFIFYLFFCSDERAPGLLQTRQFALTNVREALQYFFLLKVSEGKEGVWLGIRMDV